MLIWSRKICTPNLRAQRMKWNHHILLSSQLSFHADKKCFRFLLHRKIASVSLKIIAEVSDCNQGTEYFNSVEKNAGHFEYIPHNFSSFHIISNFAISQVGKVFFSILCLYKEEILAMIHRGNGNLGAVVPKRRVELGLDRWVQK